MCNYFSNFFYKSFKVATMLKYFTILRLFAIIFIVFLSFQNNSFAQTISFPCQDGNCNAVWGQYSTTVYLPDYPSCPITVKYAKRDCPSGTEYKIVSIGWDVYAGGCSTLTQKMYPGGFINSQIDVTFQNKIYRDIFFRFSQLDFLGYYNALDDVEKVKFNCGTGTKMKMYKSFEAVCNSKLHCGYDFGIDPNGHSVYFWTLTNIPCSTECCVIEYSYCYDTTTLTPVVGTENRYRTGTASCDINYTPPAICGDWLGLQPSAHYQDKCFESCWSDE